MKKLLFFVFLLYAGNTISAQCSYDSTITSDPDLSGGNEVQCVNQTIVFTAPAGYDSYQWKYKFSTTGTPNEFTGETQNTLSIVAGDIGFAYVFVTITDDGCTEDSNEIFFDTWVFSSPAIEHSADTVLCYGETSIISNAFNGPVLFRWYKDGELVLEGPQDFYEVSEAGDYLLEVAYGPCPDIWYSSGVPVSFSVVGEEVLIEETAGTLFTTENGVGYQWFLDGNEITGANSFSYTPVETGMYSVEVTFQGAETCDISSDEYFFEFLSNPENQFFSDVYFMNTVSVNNEFVLRNTNNKKLQVSFFDTTGKLVQTQTATEQNIVFNASSWKNGIYFCHIETEGKRKTLSLIR